MRFFMRALLMFGNQIACAAVAIYITKAFDLTADHALLVSFVSLPLLEP